MKGQKKFYLLLIILSLIALFSISCNNSNNKDKTGTEEAKKERKLSYYEGNWYGKPDEKTAEMNILTINADSSVILKDGTNPDVTIPPSSVTRVSDTSYIASYHDSTANKNTKFTFIFSSDTQGKFTMEQEGVSPATLDITKK